MRLVYEYRIPMPLTVEEQKVGFRFIMVEGMYRYRLRHTLDNMFYVKLCRETGGGAGTLFLEHLPYSLQDYPEVCPIDHFKGDSKYKDEEGVYTYKTHHAGNRMPWWLVTLFHKDMLVMHEETWNSHPFYHQTFTLPELFASKFSTTVKSMVVATEPKGELEMEENIFGLSPEDLERRQMSTLNIADKMFEKKMPGGKSPDIFKSRKTGRGPLSKGWQDSDALSVTHMLIIIHLAGPDVFPKKLHSFGQRMIKKLMWRYYGEMFLKMDDWIDLTTEEIVKLEEECMRELPMRMLEKDKGDVTSWV